MSPRSARCWRPGQDYISDGLSHLDPSAAAGLGGGGGIPNLAILPAPVRTVVESGYGDGIADVFLYAAPFAFVAFVLTLFIKEVALRTSGALAQAAEVRAPSRSCRRWQLAEDASGLVPGGIRGQRDRGARACPRRATVRRSPGRR